MTGKQKTTKSGLKTKNLKVLKSSTVQNVKEKKNTKFRIADAEDSYGMTREAWEFMNE